MWCSVLGASGRFTDSTVVGPRDAQAITQGMVVVGGRDGRGLVVLRGHHENTKELLEFS